VRGNCSKSREREKGGDVKGEKVIKMSQRGFGKGTHIQGKDISFQLLSEDLKKVKKP